MEARELRSGNLLQGKPFSHPRMGMWSNGITRITAYGIAEIEIGNIPKDHYSPIPLSPEILEKAGFKYVDGEEDGMYWYETEWPIVGELITCDKERGNYVFDADTDTLRITSLHQLMNLYFALTGNELNINL